MATLNALNGAAFVVAAFVTTAHGYTNVFSDAVFWFRGGKDCVTADGQLERGEFFDDLHADDSSHSNHKMEVTGYAENGTFATEPVVFPALGAGVTNDMRVLRISNNSNNVSGTSKWYPLSVNPYSIFSSYGISNEYTVVYRLRLESATNRTEWLMKVGYGGNKGLLLGFKESKGHPDCKGIRGWCTRSETGSNSSFDFSPYIFAPTNTWIDLSVAVGGGEVRVGIAAPSSAATYGKNPSIAFRSVSLWTDNCTLGEESSYLFFAQTAQESTSSGTAFLGSVQQIAIWKRKLSDQGVMEAFGMPRPAIFRTGLDNDSSSEFGGMRSGSSQTIDGLGSWQEVSNEMIAGDTWTVNFNALSDEAGLAQVFSMRSLPASATARIAVSLNGTSLGTRTLGGVSRAFWPVSKGLLVQGANALTISRVDGNAGVLNMDSMELGGSLGIGVPDSDKAEMVPTARVSSGSVSMASGNPMHWPNLLTTYGDIVAFKLWVDPDLVDRCSGTLKIRTRCLNRSATQVKQGTETFALLVNGVTNLVRDCSMAWRDSTVEFARGELSPGWNDVLLSSEMTGTCYWEIDYYRFESVLNRGFSIPPRGFTIKFR